MSRNSEFSKIQGEQICGVHPAFGPVAISVPVNGKETIVTAWSEPDYHTSPAEFDCYGEEEIADFDNGLWHFIGVTVKLMNEDGDELAVESLWGIESFAGGAYIADVANDLMHEAVYRLEHEAK